MNRNNRQQERWNVAYQLLLQIGRHAARDDGLTGAYQGRSKLEILFGPRIGDEIKGKVIIDLGCGFGQEAIEMAQRGAEKVIGIDIRPRVLDVARMTAEKAGVSDRCIFTTYADEKADIIFSIDGFEHYDEPKDILRLMRRLVKDDGRVIVTFGPPWYHPLGGHLFSVFPWAHCIFTEKALIRWRSDFKSDGATRFHEVEGGLNQMTIRRFVKLIKKSDFEVESLELIPIRKLRFLHNRLTREFLTSSVRCRLIPRKSSNT